jgi:hypothetical protein
VSASEPPAAAELAALRQEIEQVHAEVHELADQLADLRQALDAVPGWLRGLMRLPPRPLRPDG